MTMWQGSLERIDQYRWRLPRATKPGMRVDGVIYSSEVMIKDIVHDKSLEQVANVVFLPGIVSHSLSMPDIHWGYGAPIGSVGAFDAEEGGVVAPGFVGYDINCLSVDTEVLTEHGYRLKIQNLENDFWEKNALCMDFDAGQLMSAKIKGFLKKKVRNKILKVRTATGKEIIATEDHPFYTKYGMKPLAKLAAEDEIAIHAFTGVNYERASDKVIVSEDDIRKTLLTFNKSVHGASSRIIIRRLTEKGLLPLRLNSPKMPYLIKLMGMLYGDASINFIGARKDGIISFFGQRQDLLDIGKDIANLGYTPSRVYDRITRIEYKGEIRQYKNQVMVVNASSLVILFAALGVPIGRKVSQSYRVPVWLRESPLWQKRLFLSALFGAELTRPRPKESKRGNFYAPAFSMSKRVSLAKNGYDFMHDIACICDEFGIKTTQLSQRREHINTKGEKTYYYELIFSTEASSLINLWGKVGYSYNKQKSRIGLIACHYLSLKTNVLNIREKAVEEIRRLRNGGMSQSKVLGVIGSEHVGIKLIHCADQKVDFKPRIPYSFPSYGDFKKEATLGLKNSTMLWDRIESIESIDYHDWVYDLSIDHSDHNFVANNFVVSNCGVRLVRTNLTEEDIKPRLSDLVNTLYNDVPAGVGSKGDIKVSEKDERKLLAEGAGWVVRHGYGTEEDLEYTEDHGAIKGANPDGVSDRAYERGKRQSGTLGSGNHFLEIQVVDEVYDETAANIFGIAKGSVTLMIHSGSRGLGYQVCDEYAKGMIRTLAKYNISVPDRQLACAPVNSEEGQAYLGAMKAAANYAWANRQCLMHLARLAFGKVFHAVWETLGMNLIYDVAHNIAKLEKHNIDGKEKTLCVHRKGATRAFPPGHPDLPAKYSKIGQPVIIPGDMGRNSYLLVGTKKAEETFYSTCHGAGRRLSRSAAVSALRGRSIARELEGKGILVRSSGRETLAEEAPEAYKDVNEVVGVVDGAGISKRVCRMRPIGVIKG